MEENKGDFWKTDVTTSQDRQSWFSVMSTSRKLVYVFILLFVVAWAFLLGFNVVCAMQPDIEDYVFVTAEDLLEDEDIAVTPPEELVQLTGTKVILVVGCDMREGESSARSDTIMLCFLNMDTREISVVSFPRDSYVSIPGVGKDKINAAFNYGGIDLLKDTLENLSGMNIDNYVIVNFEAFSALVDAVGGVDIYVDTRMYKPSENIDLQVGMANLDGYEALAYVRYRGYVDGDFSRIEHQQNFMSELAKQLLSSVTVAKVPELASIFMQHATTDISLTEAIELGIYAMNMDYDNLHMYTAPGSCMWMQRSGLWLSYVILNPSQMTEILRGIVGPDEVFTPNVIDDGGEGYYTIPEGEEDPTLEGEGIEGGEGTEGTEGTEGNEGNEGNEGQGQEGTGEDPSVSNPDPSVDGEGGIWDVPSPE